MRVRGRGSQEKKLKSKVTNIFCYHHQEVTALSLHYIPPNVSLMTYKHMSTYLRVFCCCSYRNRLILFMSSVSQSSLTLWPVATGFSVHGLFQARILEQVAISFSRGSFRPEN